jgi:hypothetical protein
MSAHKKALMTLALVTTTALLAASPTRSAEPELPRDGWVSWEVAAVEDAPFYCCFENWRPAANERKSCNLDGPRGGYGSRDNDGVTDSVKVYARLKGGKLEHLRALAAACPVETRTPIQQINLATDDSVRWLVAQTRQWEASGIKRESVGEHALAALAIHRGDLANQELASFARNSANGDVRKKAVFWSAVLRGAPGAELTRTMMFNDRDADFREHAAFAITLTKSPRIAADLIQLGNSDKVGDVRAKAWFWLAQTGATEAEAAIGAALRKDSDEDVREQAIFALSQLPDERATQALIAAAEDQSLSREQRKRAVFWLSQSESDSAQVYLEKVLTRSAARD